MSTCRPLGSLSSRRIFASVHVQDDEEEITADASDVAVLLLTYGFNGAGAAVEPSIMLQFIVH